MPQSTHKGKRGAKSSAKRAVGRPIADAFKSVEHLQSLIDAYFKQCKGKNKKITYWNAIPTKRGLAIFLDVTKQTLLNYEKGEFFDPIKKAYDKIEEAWMQQLPRPYPTGAIFYLKNAFKEDWRDRYDHTNDGNQFPAPTYVIYGDTDPLKKALEEERKKK